MNKSLKYKGRAVDGVSAITELNGIQVCVTASDKDALQTAIQKGIANVNLKETFTIPKEDVVESKILAPSPSNTRH